MQYLTYDEYKQIGGTCDESAFGKNIVRVCGIINNETHGRVAKMSEVPDEVKHCIRDLIDFLSENEKTQLQKISGKSQSVGGVSESVSYTVLNSEEVSTAVSDIVFDYLNSVKYADGEGLLYRGRGYY